MKILVYAGTGGSGGFHRYCEGLFGSGSWPRCFDTLVVGGDGFLEKLQNIDVGIRTRRHSWPESRHRLQRYLWHLLIYPRIRRSFDADVEFYAQGDLPIFASPTLRVTTCHNLLPFEPVEVDRYQGTPFQRTLQNWRSRQSRAFLKSSGVIFLSNYSRDRMLSVLPNIKTYAVIPHGLADECRLPVRETYRFRSKITVLYVSPAFRYKHQDKVILAIGVLRRQTGLDIQLRLVGGGRTEDLGILQHIIASTGAAGYVTIVPFASREIVIKELMMADLFVFASSCETFGIGLLEAMGARLPIACSNRSGLPEILGDAGEYCDPELPEEISNALARLLRSEDHRRTLGERAFQRSEAFTWKKCAEQTGAFLDDIGKRKATQK